jgi:hypothetical protein
MNRNNIVGSLPEDWSALAAGLGFVSLSYNEIVGFIPTGIVELKALKTLNLNRNKLTGVVPGLPFAQYTGYCDLQDGNRTQSANAYVCPLPPNSSSCTGGPPTCSCTGTASASLPQSECEWWINFFDTMGGENWTNCASDRTDPCACSYNAYGTQFGVTCGGGHVTTL